MSDLLESPFLFLVLGLGLLFVTYLEMPSKEGKRRGERLSLPTRLSRLSRTGWGTLIPGVLLLIGAVAGFLDS